MKKIGIVTTVYGNNFGEALQAYACRKAINTYVPDSNADLIRFIVKKQSTLVNPGFERYEDEVIKKNALFDEFRHNEIGINGTPLDHLSMENAPVFDKYVFGSDQIWNTDAWKIPEFFGAFVPQNKGKIAYAASVGMNIKQDTDCSLFERYIDTFDCISVREKTHVDFIRRFTDKPVHFVADPTLLLDRDIYINLFAQANTDRPSRDYIFYYQPHSADGAIISLVNKLSRTHNWDVVHTFADIPRGMFAHDSYSARFSGPREFLKYIHDAKIVITRSYHAAVFSILFRKPFYVYVDKKTGSRFESLLTTLGLEDRLVYDYLNPEEVTLDIDYTAAEKKLAEFKMDSIDFLKKALE